MKKSERLLWLFGGILIGTAAGAAATSTKGSAKSIDRLLSQSTSVIRKNTEQLKSSIRWEAGEFAKKVRKQISNPVPDLYKATENITMDQPETVYGW